MWFGRDVFLRLYFQAAVGVYTQLLHGLLPWSKADQRAFLRMHTHGWNGWLLIPRTDPYFREFMFFDQLEDKPMIAGLVATELTRTQPIDDSDGLLSTLWHLYLRVSRVHVVPREATGRTNVQHTPDDRLAGAEEHITGRIAEEWFTEACAVARQEHFAEHIRAVLEGLPERERRIVELLADGRTQRGAAKAVGCHESTVSRVLDRLRKDVMARANSLG
jgi:hypothetical protein